MNLKNEVKFLDVKQFLKPEELSEYYDKIKPFKEFCPSAFIVGNNYSVEYELHKYIKMSSDEYKKFKENIDKKNKIYIGKKGNLKDGYMYGFEEKDVNSLDEIDKKFLESQSEFDKINLYGYHTYGGYYGFFRPDLTEVIHMLNTKISLTELNDIERIYVTTEAYPTYEINDCYDRVKDKHKGLTTYYIIKKSQKKQRKRKCDNDGCSNKQKRL